MIARRVLGRIYHGNAIMAAIAQENFKDSQFRIQREVIACIPAESDSPLAHEGRNLTKALIRAFGKTEIAQALPVAAAFAISPSAVAAHLQQHFR